MICRLRVRCPLADGPSISQRVGRDRQDPHLECQGSLGRLANYTRLMQHPCSENNKSYHRRTPGLPQSVRNDPHTNVCPPEFCARSWRAGALRGRTTMDFTLERLDGSIRHRTIASTIDAPQTKGDPSLWSQNRPSLEL